MHLQSSIQVRSQDGLWTGGNGSRLVCGGQSRSDGTLWSRVQSPLKWWVNQPEELNSIPLSIHEQRRHQGRRQFGPWVLNDWRSAVPFFGVTPKQTGYTCNQLAINDAHKRTLHGGPTVTVALMRRQIWVTQAMKKASVCIKKCVTGFRFNSRPTQQLMADLHSSRIEVPEKAFSCLGLDFAGLLTFKNGIEWVKGYVAVLISFASKAVHLEAVSSLTWDAMLAALRRFIARRGIPSKNVSDKATNFVGAMRDLNELEKVVRSGA